MPRKIYLIWTTGFFYKAMPDRTFVIAGKPISGIKMDKSRLTVAVCVNMTGCEKLKLLVIGKAKNPRAFKIGKKPVKLPPLIEYEGAPNAWMNEETFSNWLRRLDQKMRHQGRHILLLLDNFSGHSQKLYKPTNIKLVFFPPNTTAMTQPLDAGII